MAVPNLTESELREALSVLDTFKKTGLTSSRLDPVLPSGKVISFQKGEGDKEWVLK